MINSLSLKYFFSYLGLIPYIALTIDILYFNIFNKDILSNFLIYYSLIIIVFIGATNWSLEKNVSNIKIIYGFIPSCFATLIVILNLYTYSKHLVYFIIITLFFLQIIFDYLLIFKKNKKKKIFYFLRIPLSSVIILIFFINLFL